MKRQGASALIDYSGQWTGWNLGTNQGAVVLDLDKNGGELVGHFYLIENAGDVAGTVGEIRFPAGELPLATWVSVRPFDVTTGTELSQAGFQEKFPDFEFPERTYLRFESLGNDVVIHWQSEIGTSGTVRLTKGNARSISQVEATNEVGDWSSFKALVGGREHGELLFRGQPKPWPLRTTFHRTSRSDLVPFIRRDIPKLYEQLSGQLKHLYNLNHPGMNASIWALAQHHGYPTPLLDWTFSPFVAAYFAYQAVDPNLKMGSVRIFILKKNRWERDNQPFFITHAGPLICLLEPISLENNRAIPQQSIMMVSNVDDIENYIETSDRVIGEQSLFAVDLPISQRLEVLNDLRLMGIGAGSLFPGIDGTCRDLRERYFPEF